MNSLLFDDARAAPNLFLWNGEIDHQEVVDWATDHGWNIPLDLMEFWSQTGGGEIFESETFLRPVLSPDGRDEVMQVTTWCRDRGMPDGLVVFYEGFVFGAVRMSDQVCLSLDTQLQVTGEYGSFDSWYVNVVRVEYAERYGLR